MVMHSFLLIGQSNMAGRGVIGSVPAIENPRLYVARNARWQHLFVPVNPDRPFSGVSLAESFADAYSRDHEADVGLIPCADGGTTMEQWRPGGLLYDHAVMQAKLAMRTSRLRGILWHQGESDCSEACAAVYEVKLTALFTALRRDLDMPELPIITGGLGDFLPLYDAGAGKWAPVITRITKRVSESLPYMAFASAEGLGAKPDNLHFDAPALREFGLRYYAAYRTAERPDTETGTAPESGGRAETAIELL